MPEELKDVVHALNGMDPLDLVDYGHRVVDALGLADRDLDALDERIEQLENGGGKFSLRDRFAIAALPAYLREGWGDRVEEIARGAYQMADAMIAARSSKVQE